MYSNFKFLDNVLCNVEERGSNGMDTLLGVGSDSSYEGTLKAKSGMLSDSVIQITELEIFLLKILFYFLVGSFVGGPD